jgi:type IV pilus assembly protein PilP
VYLKAIHKYVLIAITVCLVLSMLNTVAFSAEEQVAEEEKTEQTFTEKMAAILFQEAEGAFVYIREGRSDPFVPFVQERVVATETPVEELTGMRKFEPGQLSVVAVVMSPFDRFAMVQDSNNQGYIIREGILLGRTGVVEAIVPNKVIVKNYTYNLAGDKIYKTVEMVLKQEGEK